MEKSRMVLVLLYIACLDLVSANGEADCGGCLLLTPFIKNNSASFARELSRVDHKELLGVRSHTGFITVKEEYGSNLFFWFFPALKKLEETPWIIWLEGGPGMSSMMGLFNLIGPLKVVDGKLRRRNVTWASHYSLLFIDNPVGTGFSFTNDEEGYPKNEDDLGEQLFIFLQQFLEIFPELQKAPLFITGESYAGKYVPALGIQLHRHRGDGITINLRGMAIGNGLIDPLTMMHYSSLCQTLGILDDNQVDHVKALEESIIKHIKEQKMVEATCNFNAIIGYINKYSGVNIYNFLEDPKTLDETCGTYLERVENRQLIHVGNAKFTFDNAQMYNKMFSDIMNTTKPFLEELLEHYGVMLYSGQLDIMVPYASSRNTYKALKWSRSEEYAEAPRQNIGKQSIQAYTKSGGNFVDVVIRQAGHFVPLDQPEVLKFLIGEFINNFK